MRRIMKENPQVTAIMLLVAVIAVVCLIFRYDGEYQGYYQITEKKESEGSNCFYITEEEQEIKLRCSQEIYDQIEVDSAHSYYISYKKLRFGNGTGELNDITLE